MLNSISKRWAISVPAALLVTDMFASCVSPLISRHMLSEQARTDLLSSSAANADYRELYSRVDGFQARPLSSLTVNTLDEVSHIDVQKRFHFTSTRAMPRYRELERSHYKGRCLQRSCTRFVIIAGGTLHVLKSGTRVVEVIQTSATFTSFGSTQDSSQGCR